MGPNRWIALLALLFTTLTVSAAPDIRPATWARPLTCAGVPNFYQLDAGVYRSAQPTSAGMAELARLGVTRVLNLRCFHSDHDEVASGCPSALGCDRCRLWMWHVDEKSLVQALKTLSHPEKGPVLIHCQRGADRTGLVCALYRIVIQNWTKDEAIREYIHGGYGFAPVWQNMVRYLEKLDVERFRAAIAGHG